MGVKTMDIKEKLLLNGKKAFVTGGARGIGKSVSIALAQSGADIAIVDLDIDEAEKIAKEIASYGVKTIAVKTDVTNPDEVNKMIETILDAFGTIDIAFNNAGICINEKAEEMSYESWKKVIDINLTGVFLTAQAAGRVMIKNRKGSIINTASMSGHIVNFPQPQCAYNASKAGVIMLTKSLANEWAPYNVRVNCISPGYIATEMTLKAPDEWKTYWVGHTPVKRMGNPEELRGAVVYLASDASTFTTGTDIVIDGGFTSM
jgi:NAD(P)-dependent dehydrogenase (short-subunit alcohol dehydrogenase family)